MPAGGETSSCEVTRHHGCRLTRAEPSGKATSGLGPFPNHDRGYFFAFFDIVTISFAASVISGTVPRFQIVFLFMRRNLPPSPRWLVTQGRTDEARELVAEAEDKAREDIDGPATGAGASARRGEG